MKNLKGKKNRGGGANWMDTYGDMVTLLLCFFVLLYSISTISEENWKALVMSFNPKATQSITVTPGGDGPDAEADQAGGPIEMRQAAIDNDIEEFYQELLEFVTQTGQESNISVTKGDGKVFISFNQVVFFDGDSPALKPEAEPILDTVSEMLSHAAESIDEVRVLGHTAQANAERPNKVSTDRTLASLRAANVVIYVQEHSAVDPARLISEGVGQWRPVADNSTAEGREQNRRVEMIVSGRNLEQELQNGILQYQTE